MDEIRAKKRLEKCNDHKCKFNPNGICNFGLREMGCYMTLSIVQDAVSTLCKTIEEEDVKQ